MKCVLRNQTTDVDDNAKSAIYFSVRSPMLNKKFALMDPPSEESKHQKKDINEVKEGLRRILSVHTQY